jgi:uncharacterized protein YndB with AHSA1/START domain
MSKKAIAGILVLLAVVTYGGYRLWLASVEQAAVEWEGPFREIARETMVKEGDTWHIEFDTVFNAPVGRVYEAYTRPEQAHELAPDRVLASELKLDEGNKKVVEIRGKVLNLPVQRLVVEYTMYPDQKRITSRTLEYNLAEISSEYVFQPSPDGERTLLRFKQTSKDKLGNPLPESVQKGALKETYVTTVRTVMKALGLTAGTAS